MPKLCQTCRLPRRAYIDRAILAGRPLLAISKELDISYPSLRGHAEKRHQLPRREREGAGWIDSSRTDVPARDMASEAVCDCSPEIIAEAARLHAIALQFDVPLDELVDHFEQGHGHEGAAP